MGNLLAYSGTTAKIRAMKSNLLKDSDYQELASARNIPEAFALLKKHKGYAKLLTNANEADLHRGDIEKMLTNAIYLDFQKIYRFAPIDQRRFLDLYFHRYEVAILKTCLRMIFDHRDLTLNLRIFEDFFQKHSNINLRELSACRTTDELVANLSGTIYYTPLSKLAVIESPTLWDYEMTLDLFYFKWFFKQGDKILDRNQKLHFTETYGTTMDLLNISWIYRSKYYFHMSDAKIYAHLIPVEHHLRKENIRALVEANDKSGFNTLLKDTYYGRRYENYQIDTLEDTYITIRRNIQHKAAKNDPYSAATVISYLFEKEHEIDQVTTVLEGVRYGLEKEQILEYINY